MAELPLLGAARPGSQSNRPIASDRSGEIIGDAVARAGAGVAQAGAVRQEREDRFTYARAKATLLRADIETRAELELDQDFETHEQRYSERMAKARDEASGLIRSPGDRALFSEDADLDILRGTQEIRGAARTIEVDRAMADMSSDLEAMRSAAMQAKDEPTRTALIRNAIDMIGAARGQYGDRFTEVDATKLRQQWTRDYAEGYIAMLPPAERIAALTGQPSDKFMAGPKPAGLVQAGNIDIYARPSVKNADGSVSTVLSMSIGVDGAEVLIPRVVDGKVVSEDVARQHFLETGEHLGKFSSIAAADAYSETLHQQQAQLLARGGKASSPADFLQPDERAALLKQAQAEGHELLVRSTSLEQADRIMDAHGNDRGDALAAARKITDPEVRDAATTRINARFAEVAAIDGERNAKAFDAASTHIEQGQSVHDLDLVTWLAILTQPQRQALEAREKQLQTGAIVETDQQVWYTLRLQAANEPEAFARRNLMLDRPSLADGDFQGLADLQARMRTGDRTADETLTGVRTANQILEDTLRDIGLDPAPKPGSPQAAQVARFSRLVDDQARALQIASGRKATTEDIQGIVDGLVIKGEVPGRTFFGLLPWNREARLYEVGSDEQFSVTDADSVPAAERVQIEAALRRAGHAVTNDAVLTLYNTAQGF